MSERYIEKSFLYLVLVSVLLHLAVYGLVSLIPPEPKPPEEATMVDLKGLPDLPAPAPGPKPGPPRSAAKAHREPVHQERPRQVAPEPRLAQIPQQAPPRTAAEKVVPRSSVANPPKAQPDGLAHPLARPETPAPGRESASRAPTRGEGLFRPQRGRSEELARLFPSARGIERIEDNFRKKYEDAEQGDTRLMDTDDPSIGTFTRRFALALRDRLNAIDRYEKKGVGMTVLNIRIGRDGTVENTKILYSSGNSKLDDLATRAAHSASYVGPLPRKWDHEELNLICSFVIREGGGISATWELNGN